MTKRREYLVDPERRWKMTAHEMGVLALLEGMTEYTARCAPAYADACAANEMGISDMFQAARAMLAYAPDSLRRGAIDHAYAELMRAWHLNPDTGAWQPRMARCVYYGTKCESEQPSNRELAFFEPKSGDTDRYYCGCYGWD
jgi:hypothetical protein